MATVAPQGNSGGQAIHDAGEEIAAATGGRVKIQLYPGGVMGNDSAVLKKMRAGQLQGASFSAGGISEVYRDFQVMSLPMSLHSLCLRSAMKFTHCFHPP